MALCPFAIKRLIPSTVDGPIKPRLAILHIAVSEADSLYDYFSNRSGGIESHFYIRRDGTIEQYRDTALQADANWRANDFAVSIETQGMGEGEWTPQQLASIKRLLEWLSTVHPIPLVVPTTWDGSGVGYHILFMDEWAGKPRSCPGPDRIKQFNAVLVPWMKSMATAPHTENPPASAIPNLPKPTVAKRSPRPIGLIRKGDTGDLVKIVQRIVGVTTDGVFGPATERAVKSFQNANGLTADGVVGPLTGRKMVLAYGYVNQGDTNASVRLVQWIGGVKVDGDFGPNTKAAVVQMQAWASLTQDGVVGPLTAAKIVR